MSTQHEKNNILKLNDPEKTFTNGCLNRQNFIFDFGSRGEIFGDTLLPMN